MAKRTGNAKGSSRTSQQRELKRQIELLQRAVPFVLDGGKEVTIEWQHNRRGPLPRLPQSGELQIALLGHYLELHDRFRELHARHHEKADGWDRERRADSLAVESTLLDLMAEGGFVSLPAVKRAALPRRPDAARAALMEMAELYPMRSRGTASEPPATMKPVFQRARDTIRTARVDPYLVQRATNGDRVAQREVQRMIDRVARDTYQQYKQLLDRYSARHRRRPSA